MDNKECQKSALFSLISSYLIFYAQSSIITACLSGRTIQIADKGLNCSENIFHAVKNGDGYIFSKSVKQLPEIERTWGFLTE